MYYIFCLIMHSKDLKKLSINYWQAVRAAQNRPQARSVAAPAASVVNLKNAII